MKKKALNAEKNKTIIQGYMNMVPNLHPGRPLTQLPYFKSPHSPTSPLHLEQLDPECLRCEPVSQLSHYATMDPDSFNLNPSRKHNTRQISSHYLDTFMPPNLKVI